MVRIHDGGCVLVIGDTGRIRRGHVRGVAYVLDEAGDLPSAAICHG